MSWKLIKSIQEETDLRMILPFGLSLKVGDVISVDRDGNFTLEGSCRSLLGLSAGTPRPAQPGSVDLMRQYGKDTTYTFRIAGAGSSLFPDLPAAQAGFDIFFGASDSWLLALTGRVISPLEEINRFRDPILDAYKRRVWKPDWALVVSTAQVERMTLIASSSSNTKVALSLNATVAQDAPLEIKLTSDATIVAANQEFVKCIIMEPATAFCSALRVRDPWWGSPGVGTLSKANNKNITDIEDNQFWEDIDNLL